MTTPLPALPPDDGPANTRSPDPTSEDGGNARTGRSRRRRLAVVGIGTVAVLGILAVLLALRYLPYISDARALSSTAQVLAAELRGLQPQALDRPLITRLRGQVEDMEGQAQRLSELLRGDPLVGLARGIGPAAGPLSHGDALIAAAEQLIAAATTGLDLGDRFVAIKDGGGEDGALLSGVVELMATSTTHVDTVLGQVEAAEQSLSVIPADALGPIRRAAAMMVAPIAEYRPLLEQYQRMDDVLPGILGWGEERRYLVLAQNPAELRPTGGYIGTVGIVKFEQGYIAEQQFTDVYTLDLLPGLPYIGPPQELKNHLLGTTSWRLADANWSPHFGSSAQNALRMYSLESGDEDVDGVIALNTFAIDRLLGVTGPVTVPEYDVTVRQGEVTMTAMRLTRGISTPDSQRKEFLNVLATMVLDRVRTLPSDRWVDLYEAFQEMAVRREILAWFADPGAQEVIAGTTIAGGVRQAPGDYVYVVEANLAPTSKYNLVVQRTTTLDVGLESDGSTTNRLTLAWQNDAGMSGEPYATIRSFSTNTQGLYGAYVRLLVPADSQLLEATGQAQVPISGAQTITTEANRTSFGNYVPMEPGGSSLTYVWSSPGVSRLDGDVWAYRLILQKQPGMTAETVTVNVALPTGADVEHLPDGATEAAGTVTWSGALETDQFLDIRYRLP